MYSALYTRTGAQRRDFDGLLLRGCARGSNAVEVRFQQHTYPEKCHPILRAESTSDVDYVVEQHVGLWSEGGYGRSFTALRQAQRTHASLPQGRA